MYSTLTQVGLATVLAEENSMSPNHRWLTLGILFAIAFGSLHAQALKCADQFSQLFRGTFFSPDNSWTQVAAVDLENDGKELLALVESVNGKNTIFGKSELVEVLPGYMVYQISDSYGAKHLVDPHSAKILKKHQPLTHQETNALILAKPVKTQVSVDKNRIKSFICARRATLKQELLSDPKVKQAFNVLDRQIGTDSLPTKTVLKKIMPVCAASVTLPFVGGFYTTDKREKAEDNLISDHQSNFTEGLMVMGFIHSCLIGGMGTLDPNVLKMVLGFNIVGNVYSEVGMGQDKPKGIFAQPVNGNGSNSVFGREGEKVVTDFGDLTTGMAGVVLYYGVVKAIENSYGFKVSKMCD